MTTTIRDIRQKIETDYLAAFPQGGSFVTLLDNDSRKPPKNQVIFARLSVRWGVNNQASFGVPNDNTFRQLGLVIVQVFGILGEGSADIEDIVKSIIIHFRGRTSSDPEIVHFAPFPKIIGKRNGKWQVNVICPFRSDEEFFTGLSASATKLAVSTQPVDIDEITPLTVVIEIQDASSARVSTDSTTVITIAISSGTGSIASGDTAVVVRNGRATFVLYFTGGGTHKLQATAGGLTSVETLEFELSSLAISMVITVEPTDVEIDVVISPSVVVEVQDLRGDPTFGYNETIIVSLIGSGVLSGTLSKSMVNGSATFADLEIDTEQVNAKLRFVSESFTEDSVTFDVVGPLLPQTNLVAEWRHLTGSGQTLFDSVGSADGQLGTTAGVDSADPTWIAEGLDYDGGDLVKFGTAGPLVSAAQWTMLIAAKLPTPSSDRQLFTKADYTNFPSASIELRTFNGNVDVFYYNAVSAMVSYAYTGQPTIILFLVYDNSTLKIYQGTTLKDTSISMPSKPFPSHATEEVFGNQSIGIGAGHNEGMYYGAGWIKALDSIERNTAFNVIKDALEARGLVITP